MIQNNVDGQPVSQAFADAMGEPSVSYSMKLYHGGSDLGAVIKRARLDLGAGEEDGGTFAPASIYGTQFEATLADVPSSILGDELEVRVGVDVGGSYEYVAVAWVTVVEESAWRGVSEVRAVGRMGLMRAPHGLSEGDYAPSAVAAAIQAATGVSVAVGAFQQVQDVTIAEGGTCRDAIASMCARLGGYACELDGGISVLPYSSTSTAVLPAGHVTGQPELGALYEVDGIEVAASSGTFAQGTGRCRIEDATATAATAAVTWGNISGYAFTPAKLDVALVDPRWTPADVLSLAIGGASYSIPARGISITYDGGYFGTLGAVGMPAEAEQATVKGAVERKADSAAALAQEAQAAAEATNQHFWHRSTDPSSDGAGTGAFVTDEEQATFLEAIASGTEPTPSRPLHNLLMNAEGILLRAAKKIRAAFTQSGVAFYDGNGNAAGNIVASFGSGGATIGKTSGVHTVLDSTAFKMVDGYAGSTVASFGRYGATIGATTDVHATVNQSSLSIGNGSDEVLFDVRERSGQVMMMDTYVGDGATAGFNATTDVAETPAPTVTVDGTQVAYTLEGRRFTLGSAPASLADIRIVYRTTSTDVSMLTFGGARTGYAGDRSVALGYEAVASGRDSIAEGSGNAYGISSHAEGVSTDAFGWASHAEGMDSTARGSYSHAEGNDSTSNGECSHAEGQFTSAGGESAHAEGNGTAASGSYSHAEGNGTIAASTAQHAAGRYNIGDSSGVYAEVIGNGMTPSERSNARTLDWSGNAWFAGNISASNINASYGGDMDDLTVGGIYYIATTATNAPEATFALCMVASSSSGNVVQLFAARTGRFYVRYRSTSWDAWSEVNGLEETSTASEVVSGASGITVNSASFAVRGGSAMLTMSVKGFSATTGTQSVGTVAAGKRPAIRAYGGGNNDRMAWCRVGTDGAVEVNWKTAPSATASYIFEFAYVLG